MEMEMSLQIRSSIERGVYDELFTDYCVNDKCIRYELAKRLANSCGVRYLPASYMTPERCAESVRTSARHIAYLPGLCVTQELYEIAVSAPNRSLFYLPESMIDNTLALRFVSERRYELAYVPLNLRTYELCLLSVALDGLSLMFVPEHLKTHTLVLVAVRNNGYAIRYAGAERNNPEVIQTSKYEKAKRVVIPWVPIFYDNR